MQALQGLVGVAAIPLLAWAFCEDRKALPLRLALATVGGALALQTAIALVLLKVPASRVFFDAVGSAFLALRTATETGMRVVFGYLSGGPAPFEVTNLGQCVSCSAFRRCR